MADLLAQARIEQRAGNFAAAETTYRRLLPCDTIEALHGLGLLAQQRGDLATAATLIEAAHRITPSARSAHNLAVVLSLRGRIAMAIERTREAITLEATYVPARFGLATLLATSGARYDAAAELIRFADEAVRAGDATVVHVAVDRLIALDTDHVSLLWLANLLHIADYEDASRRVLDIRLRKTPDDIGARLTRAMAHFTRIHVDAADMQRRHTLYAAELAEIAILTEHASQPVRAAAANVVGLAQPFLLAYHALDDRKLQRCYAEIVAKLVASLPFPAAPLPAAPCPAERIRVGFASAHLHFHSVSKTHGGWIDQLDRSRFAVYGYQFSDARDATSQHIEALCDAFTRGIRDLASWRTRILADAPHVMIYLDIGMEQTAVRLAAMRLAPVQCTTWGHPVTSGLPTIDYYLSSEAMEPPDGDAHYTERLIRLPHLGICYAPPPTTGPPRERRELGLRDDTVVYLCCQSLYKYLPQYDNVWPRIAARVPTAQFVFLAPARGAEAFRDRLERSFAAAGLAWQQHCVLSPTVPHDEFSALLRVGDVFLDSIGWNGCNSTLEAIECGLPIVTIPTALMRGRHSAAILGCMGLAEWIAPDIDAYVDLAVRLANAEERTRFAAALAEGKSRVFNDTSPVRALEEFLSDTVRLPVARQQDYATSK